MDEEKKYLLSVIQLYEKKLTTSLCFGYNQKIKKDQNDNLMIGMPQVTSALYIRKFTKYSLTFFSKNLQKSIF